MRGDLIAIDLEMTGLDPAQDAILEIGAVRLRDGQIIDEYSTLIDPQRSISQVVSQLTGITDEAVIGQPRIAQALPALTAFVGDAPLIAHNIGFDASFLARQGVLQSNLRIDTMELALVLLPRAPRYALGSLAAQLGITLDRAHRALDDARATALIFWRLWERALALPQPILEEIVHAAGRMPWDARAVFASALEAVSGTAAQTDFVPYAFPALQPRPLAENTDAWSSADSGQAVWSAEVVFAPDGPLAAALPGYEVRGGQVQMARAVETALADGHHAVIEAATGIGKTMAYLAPTLAWAQAQDARVVISTSTIALQTQLVSHDVPLIARALGIDVSTAVLKGRDNYLCPRRLSALRARGPANLDELRLLARLLVWLLETESGERQDITLRGPMEHYLWSRLSAADEDCTGATCEAAGGACPFYRARRAAERARVVIVNHALLVADGKTSQPVLPPFEAAIIDEAQHLEDAITQSLTFVLDAQQLKHRLTDVSGKTRGLLSDLLRAVRAGAPEAMAQQFDAYGEIVREAARAMQMQIGALFETLESLMSELRAQRQEATSHRVTAELRKQTAFEHAGAVWRGLAEYFDAMCTAMRRLHSGLRRLGEYPIPDYLNLTQAVAASARFFSETQTQLEGFFNPTGSDRIYWLHQAHEERGVSINSAPLHVGALVDQHLWSARRSVILTGATLRGGDTFDLLRERLGAGEIETLTIPSPYDFKAAVLLYLPTDLPEPNDRSRYQAAVERALIELATALDGRLLALFTSYTQLRQTSQAIAPRLALGNIAVLDQSDGQQLALEGFRSVQRAVLMGTRSYWEGIDLPGDLLRGVAIVRLPFSVPTDPVFAARSEQYADPFGHYSVPDAVLKFRQGFGRLIRSAQDRGVVTVLDGRILSKGYGRAFLDALPDCTVQRGSLAGLADAARTWLTQTG